MSSLLDRLNQELEAFGKRAQSALDEGKSQIELMRIRRQRDSAARELGLLFHRRERTGESEPKRLELLMLRLDDFESQIAALEREAAAAKGETASVDEQPAPASPEPVDAEVVSTE